MSKEQYIKVFKMTDTDKSGYLTIDELTKLLTQHNYTEKKARVSKIVNNGLILTSFNVYEYKYRVIL